MEPEVSKQPLVLPLQGSLMDATMCGSDGSGKDRSVLEFLAVGQFPAAFIRGSCKGGVRAHEPNGVAEFDLNPPPTNGEAFY